MTDNAPVTLVQLNAALAPILTAVTAMGEKVTALGEKVTALDEKVTDLHNLQNIAAAKAFDSQIGRSERLVRVPCRDSEIPNVDFPETICHLLVSGNQQLPDGGNNNWSLRKSFRLQYGQ